MGHVVEIGEVLVHWRKEREGKVGDGWMGRRGEPAEEETMSERRGGRGTHTLTKGFLRCSGSGGREGSRGRVRCGRTDTCNRGWFFLETISSGRLSLHVCEDKH